jgi:hypothetical protein
MRRNREWGPSWTSWSGCGTWASGSEVAFRENDIDQTVLPNLTTEDLKELGVASLGHHRKLLDVIAAPYHRGVVGRRSMARYRR